MRLVIVGHGPTLRSQQRGKEIDDHDVVVRMKQGYHYAQDFPEQYGERAGDTTVSTLLPGEGVGDRRWPWSGIISNDRSVINIYG